MKRKVTTIEEKRFKIFSDYGKAIEIYIDKEYENKEEVDLLFDKITKDFKERTKNFWFKCNHPEPQLKIYWKVLKGEVKII